MLGTTLRPVAEEPGLIRRSPLVAVPRYDQTPTLVRRTPYSESLVEEVPDVKIAETAYFQPDGRIALGAAASDCTAKCAGYYWPWTRATCGQRCQQVARYGERTVRVLERTQQANQQMFGAAEPDLVSRIVTNRWVVSLAVGATVGLLLSTTGTRKLDTGKGALAGLLTGWVLASTNTLTKTSA